MTNETKHKSNVRFYIITATCIVISIFLHFWQIGSIPNGFALDESSIAYNAYCILKTGTDEYGTRFPLFFRGFDNYHDPVMIYMSVPLIKVFGMQKWVIRSLSSLFHLVASIFFFFLVYRYTRDRWTALSGGMIFSLIPWVFPISRSAMSGYTAMLTGIIAGWLLLLLGLERKKYRYAIAAAFGWALAMYSHNCGRPMTAIYLIVFVFSFNWVLFKRWKYFLAFILSYIILLVPMIISFFADPIPFTNRFSKISIFCNEPTFGQILGRFFTRYLDYFSPGFLFFQGDSNLRHHTGLHGELFLFLIPFILVGIYVSIRFFKRNPYYRFLLLGTFVYPVAATLTITRFHSTRSINGTPFWVLLASVGFAYVWRYRKKYYLLLILTGLTGCWEVPSYLFDYFFAYPVSSRPAFHASFVESLEYAFSKSTPGKALGISFSAVPGGTGTDFKPGYYAHILFCAKIDPEKYRKYGIPPEKVYLYTNGTPKPGFLLRHNIAILKSEDGRLKLIRNPERFNQNLFDIEKIIPDPFTPHMLIDLYRQTGEHRKENMSLNREFQLLRIP